MQTTEGKMIIKRFSKNYNDDDITNPFQLSSNHFHRHTFQLPLLELNCSMTTKCCIVVEIPSFCTNSTNDAVCKTEPNVLQCCIFCQEIITVLCLNTVNTGGKNLLPVSHLCYNKSSLVATGTTNIIRMQ